MTTQLYRLSKRLPVLAEADVVVAGGGPGGLGAAVLAARAGARTVLVERYGFLGGMASAGEVHPFMHNHVDGRPLDTPVYTDWLAAMQAYWPTEAGCLHISKDGAMLAAEDLCRQAGVEILYHHTVTDTVVCKGRLQALIVHSKSGLGAVRAPVYVDCTGDADVAALAGCAFEQGGPSGHCQPMTLCFKLCRVDRARAPDGGTLTRLYHEAKARGEIQCPRENVLCFSWLEPDVVHFNTTRVIHRAGTSGTDLCAAEMEAREQLRQYLRFLRAHVPGFEAARLHSVAHHIGVRETRRVLGQAYLTREAFLARQKFPDAIARARYPIDIHNPDGTGTELVHLAEGEWYEIPYGCIVARDLRNLLVGGRPISVDHAIHSSMRVMPIACSVGQAAGVAAALAAQRGVDPRSLDGTEVRRELVRLGARL